MIAFHRWHFFAAVTLNTSSPFALSLATWRSKAAFILPQTDALINVMHDAAAANEFRAHVAGV